MGIGDGESAAYTCCLRGSRCVPGLQMEAEFWEVDGAREATASVTWVEAVLTRCVRKQLEVDRGSKAVFDVGGSGAMRGWRRRPPSAAGWHCSQCPLPARRCRCIQSTVVTLPSTTVGTQ